MSQHSKGPCIHLLMHLAFSTVIDYRISRRVKEQFEAFMSGFSELIPQDLINVFDERELELLIGGMSDIDVYVSSITVISSVLTLTLTKTFRS